ncbi:DUF2254 domain-containing protein [Jannaschia sp. R86511]|uniref:DUF2254 domain-containing protein n=1 Tax=Jannaschia sp. R86511 TaxID=3093853 RepID=UPI0036D37E10
MNLLRSLGQRFWFLPAVLSVLASAAAVALVALDRLSQERVTPGWTDFLLYRVGAAGSRDLLGAIATSSLAVAGTTFSITMAVLALTSSSYGPRLVRNFMADKGNQTVLGVYVATFLYCLLVLRSVRVVGDPAVQDADVFVPHLAVNGAVVLAVANVGVLIYFIHHISDSVQVSTLASGVRAQLLSTVDRLYPDDVGTAQPPAQPPSQPPAQPPGQLLPDLSQDGHPVVTERVGYVESVSADGLLKLAQRHDVVVDLRVAPGDYVLHDDVILLVSPRDGVDERLAARLRRTVVISNARTPHQDVAFALQQLTEMAVRALSPGTNDPYTAQNAIDDLSAGLTMLVSRPAPSPWRRDPHGVVRVHAPAPDMTRLVATVLDQLRWYAADAPAVMHACVTLVGRVGSHAAVEHATRLRLELLHQLRLLTDAFEAAGHHPDDQAHFAEKIHATRHALVHGTTDRPAAGTAASPG